ncbi:MULTISPECIES: hypothetical protein [unclassified Streptomyces]|uniref:hypothetical protein n=1 Tax=unclassified Streptomyces TaxID=2593676 RepID=UPI003812DDF3
MTAVVDRPDRAATEERLRAALDAKARTVGPDSLRRAVPPSALARPRVRMRTAAVAVLGLAAALACVLLAVTAAQRDNRPVPPASPTHSPTVPEQRRDGPHPSPVPTGRTPTGEGTPGTAPLPEPAESGAAQSGPGPAAVTR